MPRSLKKGPFVDHHLKFLGRCGSYNDAYNKTPDPHHCEGVDLYNKQKTALKWCILKEFPLPQTKGQAQQIRNTLPFFFR